MWESQLRRSQNVKSSDFLLETEHMFFKGKITQGKLMLEKHIRYEKWRVSKPLGNAVEVTWVVDGSIL